MRSLLAEDILKACMSRSAPKGCSIVDNAVQRCFSGEREVLEFAVLRESWSKQPGDLVPAPR